MRRINTTRRIHGDNDQIEYMSNWLYHNGEWPSHEFVKIILNPRWIRWGTVHPNMIFSAYYRRIRLFAVGYKKGLHYQEDTFSTRDIAIFEQCNCLQGPGLSTSTLCGLTCFLHPSRNLHQSIQYKHFTRVGPFSHFPIHKMQAGFR